MDECRVCHKQDHLETHHIKDQQFANQNNMIHHHHKNIQHNLVPLCKACHLKVTNQEITIFGWKETSQGKKLQWKNIKKKISSRKKFNKKELIEIKKIYEVNKKVNKKDLIKLYDIKHGIKISQSTLKKIIDDKY
jgi:hypothetical protein